MIIIYYYHKIKQQQQSEITSKSIPMERYLFIKQRLNNIIDQIVAIKCANLSKNDELIINEALLQAFQDILEDLLIPKNGNQVYHNKFVESSKDVLSSIKLPSAKQTISKHHHIITPKFHGLHLRQPFLKQSETLKYQTAIKKNSTCTFISESICYIIGGCRNRNPNKKSKNIYKLDIQSKNLQKIGQLPVGVSSHSVLLMDDTLYVVGGNRDQNIISKRCYAIITDTLQINEIAALNYPAASMSLCPWNDEYFYKIGGVGDCFGKWDISPYIQRYSTIENQWQLINPIINLSDNILKQFNLYANSLSYRSPKNQLVILGGFNMKGKPNNHITLIEIVNQDQHILTGIQSITKDFGKANIKMGGFMSTTPIISAGSTIIAEQTLETGNKILVKIQDGVVKYI